MKKKKKRRDCKANPISRWAILYKLLNGVVCAKEEEEDPNRMESRKYTTDVVKKRSDYEVNVSRNIFVNATREPFFTSNMYFSFSVGVVTA